VVKVAGRIFILLGIFEGTSRVGVKLAVSAEMALTLPFVSPTGYWLARSGWGTGRFAKGDEIPDELCGWIEQSYPAVAQKKLVQSRDARGARTGQR
jgi:predicted DNA-binding protein (MmcQ/YjbR family)